MSDFPAVKFFKTKGERNYVQAQLIWLILIGFIENEKGQNAAIPRLLTYGELAKKMGYEDARAGHTLGTPLGIVGNLCVANGLPPLNVIVVNKTTRVPGDEVVTRPDRTVVQEQQAVMAYNWYSVRIPTSGSFRKAWEAMS